MPTRANSAAVADKVSEAASLLGRKGGKVTSDRKAAAARANGKKGGRPVTRHAP